MTTKITAEENIYLTLDIRKNILKELTSNGTPSDAEDRKLLIEMLNGIDRTSLMHHKIKKESESKDKSDEVTRSIAGLLMQISEKNLFVSEHNKEIPELKDGLDKLEIVYGEDEISNEEIDFRTFTDPSEDLTHPY